MRRRLFDWWADSGLMWALLAGFPVLVIWGPFDGGDEKPEPSVHGYCFYGSVSEKQYDHCMDEVSEDSLAQRQSEAARFARHELAGCGEHSGPLCAERVDDETGEDHLPLFPGDAP